MADMTTAKGLEGGGWGSDSPLVVAGSEAGDADGSTTVSDTPLERVDGVGLRLASQAAVVALTVPAQGEGFRVWGLVFMVKCTSSGLRLKVWCLFAHRLMCLTWFLPSFSQASLMIS